MITDIHGKPYTSAAEDLRLVELTKAFVKELAQQVTHGMKTSKNGTVNIDIAALCAFIEQAYYLGRDHGR